MRDTAIESTEQDEFTHIFYYKIDKIEMFQVVDTDFIGLNERIEISN